jgi:hypothetical protein
MSYRKLYRADSTIINTLHRGAIDALSVEMDKLQLVYLLSEVIIERCCYSLYQLSPKATLHRPNVIT